jgi:thiol-disulfide isomerase/thioredoxin
MRSGGESAGFRSHSVRIGFEADRANAQTVAARELERDMVPSIRALLASLLVLASAAIAAGEVVKFAGKVVDDKGKPVKDATVGTLWVAADKKLVPQESVSVGKNGTFEAEFDVNGEKPVALMAFDKAQKRGGFVVVTPPNFREPQKITIDTLVSVSGHFDVSNIRGNPETVEMVFESSPDRSPLMRIELPAKKKATIKIPAGKYTLHLGCDGGERAAREILIPNKASHDLGEKMVLSPVTSRHARTDDGPKDDKPPADAGGKKAEKKAAAALPKLNVTDALGVNKDVKLENYRGKWVVLEFWGYWCGPCVNIGLPAWFRFADEHKSDSDRYVILTFHHSNDSKKDRDLNAIKPQIDQLLAARWKRDKFPFPILMDVTHATEAAWGVTGYPMAFLIDPDGAIVAQDHHGIDERLAEELRKSAGAKKPGPR